MADFNSVVLVGCVVKVPVLHQGTADDPTQCMFWIKTGDLVKEVKCYRRLAELCAEFLKKGRHVLVMGELGKDHVKANMVQFLNDEEKKGR